MARMNDNYLFARLSATEGSRSGDGHIVIPGLYSGLKPSLVVGYDGTENSMFNFLGLIDLRNELTLETCEYFDWYSEKGILTL